MFYVKEIFLTLQGEGFHVGTVAVFCRFSGCNVWSGIEQHRERDARNGVCARWCDTDFRGQDGPNGGKFDAAHLVAKILEIAGKCRVVVFTGGEPGLQMTDDLVKECHAAGLKVCVETNGSRLLPSGIDWICLSPKPPMPVVEQRYDEVKVVYPSVEPTEWATVAPHRFIQPQHGSPDATNACIEFLKENSDWRLSIQTHKLLSIP